MKSEKRNEKTLTPRLLLEITYMSGYRLRQFANYIHIEDGKLCFTVDKQVHGLCADIVKVPIENIESYDSHIVYVYGWEMPEEG